MNLLLQLWQELTCIESVWQDLSTEFAGEDLVEPERRALAREIREALLSAAKRLGVKKLPEGWTNRLPPPFMNWSTAPSLSLE